MADFGTDVHARISQETYTPGLLVLRSDTLRSTKVTVAAGQGVLAPGSLLGKITKGPAGASADPGNTGDGAAGDVTLGRLAQVGDYRLECIAAQAGAGAFAVFAPDGSRLADLTVGQEYAGDHLNLTLAAGDADFVVGDQLVVTVPPGSGLAVLSRADAVDGSQEPCLVLAHAVDASEADAEAMVHETGDFNETALTLGAGHTLDSIRDGLAAKGIHPRATLAG